VVSPWRDEQGKGKLGCLFSLGLVALLIYVGKDFGAVYFRYYQIKDEVKTQVGFAPALTDAAIRDRLVLKSDSLDIPIGPKDWQITRTRSPSEISISGTYTDSVVVNLPGYHKIFFFHFSPGARAPL
jgi:hypothetical protein